MATSSILSAPARVRHLRATTLRLAMLAAALGCAVGLAPLGLGMAKAAQANHIQIGQKAYGATQRIEVGLNKSIIVDLPADADEVIVSQPTIAGTILRTKRRAIVQGMAPGGTNIFFMDAAGNPITVLDVSIGDSADNLVSTLARVIPGSNISVQNFGESVALSGTVESGDDLQKALAIAGQFVGSPEKVANAITVAGSQQVMLKVTVAEVKRDTLKELGVNLSGSMSIGQVNLGFNSQQTTNTNGSSIGIDGTNFTIDAAIRALNDRNAIHLLAEPTLTAISGSPATFLAGGELPITVQDNTGVASTTWKPFGVELTFTPTVKSNGVVNLQVDTAVSELRTDGALTKRRVASTVELGAGQTLSMAGLIQETVRQRISGLPGIGEIPILGALFRSREFQRNQTELVILVTPYFARPNVVPELPTDHTVIASDAEAVFLGQMEKMYGVGQGPDGMRGSYSGTVGFMLD